MKKVTINSFYKLSNIYKKNMNNARIHLRLSDYYKMINIKIHILKIHGYLIYN